MTRPVTALYVPGDRPDRFDKAVASGADIVILDLEDAVAPHAKDAALRNVVEWLGRGDARPAVQVRVNRGRDDELRALRLVPGIAALRIPKVEAADELDEFVALAGGLPLVVLIETAKGVENAATIARHPGVAQLALGEADLASDLGTSAENVIDHVRVRLLLAARAAGLPAPMLSVFPDIRDLDGLRADTERGRRTGWFGRVAVHPSQLAVIREVFAPDPAELAWARAVIAASERGGVTTLPSGEMVDEAMRGRAREILER